MQTRYPARASRARFLSSLRALLGEPIHEVSALDELLSHPKYSHHELFYLTLCYLSSTAGNIALFPNMPPKIYELLVSRGCSVYTIAMTPTSEQELYARTLAREQYYLRDGEVLRLLIGAHLREIGKTLEEAIKSEVPFSATASTLDSVGGNVAALVGKLLKRDDCQGCREGVRITFGGGEVTVTPTARGFKLLASALAAETAEEICDSARDILRSL